tara:strand:- start:31181 stop:31669 length:489 start_codon:yes stop_codon:yes gene_type:complete
MSTNQLAKEVQQNIKESWEEANIFDEFKITDLLLANKSGNEYSGILEFDAEGESFKVDIEVIYDGDTFKWNIVDENFLSAIEAYEQNDISDSLETESDSIIEDLSMCECMELALENPNIDDTPDGCEWIDLISDEEGEKITLKAMIDCPEVMGQVMALSQME